MQTRKNTAWKYQGKEASASSAEEYTSFYNDKISITQKLVYNTYRMKAFHQLQNLRSSWFQDFRVDKYYEKPGNLFPQALNMIAVCKLHQPRRLVLWVSQWLFAKKYEKLQSKGFYWQILGEVTVLKFFQTFALDFPNCLQFFRGNFSRQEEKFLKANV